MEVQKCLCNLIQFIELDYSLSVWKQCPSLFLQYVSSSLTDKRYVIQQH